MQDSEKPKKCYLKVKFREETNCQKKNVNMDEVYLKKT